MATMAKRTVMTLYSDPMDMYSHQVRIVLAEKEVSVEILDLSSKDAAQVLNGINPYNETPTLIDKDLVLYDTQVIVEYLEERFPHPPLLPVYPVLRAQSRKMIYRIQRDWYSLAKVILTGAPKEAEAARKNLLMSLTNLAPVFADKAYFFSEEFSLVDCTLAPLLWRLPLFGIELPAKAKAVQRYAETIFKRDTFQMSLTDMEREVADSATA